jgi:hypothetical protein
MKEILQSMELSSSNFLADTLHARAPANGQSFQEEIDLFV